MCSTAVPVTCKRQWLCVVGWDWQLCFGLKHGNCQKRLATLYTFSWGGLPFATVNIYVKILSLISCLLHNQWQERLRGPTFCFVVRLQSGKSAESNSSCYAHYRYMPLVYTACVFRLMEIQVLFTSNVKTQTLIAGRRFPGFMVHGHAWPFVPVPPGVSNHFFNIQGYEDPYNRDSIWCLQWSCLNLLIIVT